MSSVPELFEEHVGEAIDARMMALATFTELGPPDLCHVTKVLDRQNAIGMKTGESSYLGSYHHIYGVNTSTPASIAAYFNVFVNAMPDAVWYGKGIWNIPNGTFCCYNAFTKMDVRVEVTMPGSVNAYAIDSDGRRFETDERTWKETFVCGILRALSVPSFITQHIECLRIFEALRTLADESAFLNAVTELFWDGKFLGTNLLTALPSNVNNRLSAGIWKYFSDMARYEQAIAFFTQFTEKDPELWYYVASAENAMHRGPAAVCTLSRALRLSPMSHTLLMIQSTVLLDQDKPDEALKLARLAVDVSPGQAQTWLHLADVYLRRKEYELVLIALNVCPMLPHVPFRMPYMPRPLKKTGEKSILFDAMNSEDQDVRSPLPPNLHGTFVDAYHVLAGVLLDVGWSQFLLRRSRAFVMEEEYQADMFESANNDKHDKKLTKIKKQTENEESNLQDPAPTAIKVSRENLLSGSLDVLDEEVKKNNECSNGNRTNEQKEEFAITNGETKDSSNSPSDPTVPLSNDSEPTAVPGGKRLCERWLDHLFMALYHDLKAFTVWTAEDMQAAKAHQDFPRCVGDWVRLGELALRLRRDDEARRAFRSSGTKEICVRGSLKLLDHYTVTGDLRKALLEADKLSTYYSQNGLTSPPTIFNHICKLIEKFGCSEVAKNAKSHDRIEGYITKACEWGVFGSDR